MRLQPAQRFEIYAKTVSVRNRTTRGAILERSIDILPQAYAILGYHRRTVSEKEVSNALKKYTNTHIIN